MTTRANIHRHAFCALAFTFAVASLSGCGAEVAGSAATAGALQAAQVEQAKARQAQAVDGFKAAQAAGVARAASAAD